MEKEYILETSNKFLSTERIPAEIFDHTIGTTINEIINTGIEFFSIHNNVSIINEAMGVDFITVKRGEKRASKSFELSVMIAKKEPTIKETAIPIKTFISELKVIFQNCNVFARSKRVTTVVLGDGSKSSRPTFLARRAHIATQKAITKTAFIKTNRYKWIKKL